MTRDTPSRKKTEEFISEASHELRTPIAAIKGCAQTLQLWGLNDSRNRLNLVRTIERHADRLSRLVDGIFKLVTLDSKPKQPKVEIVSLPDFLRRFLDRLASLANKKGISIKLHIAPRLFVLMDRAQLEEVFEGLCENALGYNHRGGRIYIEGRVEEDEVVVSIRDTGFGIPKTELPHIFEPFHRTAKARLRRPDGAGLGLSIARSIIESYGGRMWAESVNGKGSTFHFTLRAFSRDVSLKSSGKKKSVSGISEAASRP